MKERKRERARERESGLGRKVCGPSPVHSSRTIAVEEGCLGQLSSLGQRKSCGMPIVNHSEGDPLTRDVRTRLPKEKCLCRV